jgi:hypothetical protein
MVDPVKVPETVELHPGNAVAVGPGVVALGVGVGVLVGVGPGVVVAVGAGVVVAVGAGVAPGVVAVGVGVDVGPGNPDTCKFCVVPLQAPTGSILSHLLLSVIPVIRYVGLNKDTATLV